MGVVWETPLKCCAVPYTRKDMIVFQHSAVVSQLQRMGNGLFLHLTKIWTQTRSTKCCKLSWVINSLGFLHAKDLIAQNCSETVLHRKDVLHERSSAGWVKNLALWCNPLRLEMRKTEEGEREREGVPKHMAYDKDSWVSHERSYLQTPAFVSDLDSLHISDSDLIDRPTLISLHKWNYNPNSQCGKTVA